MPKPQVTLQQWEGECSLKVDLPVGETTEPVLDGEKLKWQETEWYG